MQLSKRRHAVTNESYLKRLKSSFKNLFHDDIDDIPQQYQKFLKICGYYLKSRNFKLNDITPQSIGANLKNVLQYIATEGLKYNFTRWDIPEIHRLISIYPELCADIVKKSFQKAQIVHKVPKRTWPVTDINDEYDNY